MAALYVTSLSENAGKTMLCAGLGKNWQNSGKKVGYFKPLMTETGSQSAGIGKDAAFMKQALALKEPVEEISPALSPREDTAEAIKRTYARVAQDKDVVLVDGLSLNASRSIIEALDAKVLIIHDYASSLSASLPEYYKLGAFLSGVVVNKVPLRRTAEFQTGAEGALTGAGINFLGVVPEDRVLLSLTVAELAELLQAKILNNSEKSTELVENIMLGAMTFDSGLDYFNRKNNKAAILKGERPDMQLAALQTSTRCIVLSGSSEPLPVVAKQAATRKIPLISAPGEVSFLIAIIEKAISQVKFNQEKKLPQLLEIMRRNLNLEKVSQQMGI